MYGYRIDEVYAMTLRQVAHLMESYSSEFRDRFESEFRMHAAVHGAKLPEDAFARDDDFADLDDSYTPEKTKEIDAISRRQLERLEQMRREANG